MAFKNTSFTKNMSRAYGWGNFLGNLSLKAPNRESLFTDGSAPGLFSTPQALKLGDSESVTYLHIAAGYQHGFIGFSESNGESKVTSFGLNASGQLGLGGAGEYGFGLVSSFGGKKIDEIQCGREHTLVRLGDLVFGSGNTNYGQLGLGKSKDRLPKDQPAGCLIEAGFKKLELNFPVKQMACGLDHSVLISDCGIFTMGWGADGQLGLGMDPPINHDTPTPIPLSIPPVEIKKVSSRHDCTIVLLESGKVYSWGNSEYGQGMHGKKIDRVLGIKPILFDEKVVDIAAGGSFSLLLSDSGKVFVCGFGVLGLGELVTQVLVPTEIPTLRDIKKIFASSGTASAINNNGEAFIWGLGTPASHRLGLGEEHIHAHVPHPLRLPYEKLRAESVALGGHFGLLIGSD
ncbi:hypothetical protein DSO57_1009947 [Entomophthora muscae]|uniref:Uncharacterized protein n=1 Tax=Entomophthora muscae TaxID=34485 RepID=A0ACC2UFL8_9FUNG|nr:hypothetical protein DSO57_1009947 [Entomophthora muscae]